MKVRIKELGRIVTGTTPKTSIKDYYSSNDYMFIGPSDLQNGKYIRKTEKHISTTAYSDYKSRFLNVGDICVSCIGYVGYIAKPTQLSLSNQQINSITQINENIVISDYLFYKLLSMNDYFQSINGNGSAVPIINKTIFENIEIDIHTLAEQQHIVDILGSIDAKIEKLEKENKEFQKLCLSQFKLYFNNKEKVALNKLATVTMGQSPDGNTINESSGTIFYQGRTDFGFRYPKVRLFTSAPKRMAKEDDILLSVRAPVGDVNVAMENCCIGRGLAAISSNYKHFVFYSLLAQQSDFDVYNNTGTIFGSINREALLLFAVPASNMIDVVKFDSLAATIDSKIKQNVIESIKLKELKALYLQKFFG